MKWIIIHFQNSTVQHLEHALGSPSVPVLWTLVGSVSAQLSMDQKISSHVLLDIWILIRTWIKVNIFWWKRPYVDVNRRKTTTRVWFTFWVRIALGRGTAPKVVFTQLWCFHDLRMNKLLSTQSRRRWFETPSRSLCSVPRPYWFNSDLLTALSETSVKFKSQYANFHSGKCIFHMQNGSDFFRT